MTYRYEEWIKANKRDFISWLNSKIAPIGVIVKMDRGDDGELYVTLKITL